MLVADASRHGACLVDVGASSRRKADMAVHKGAIDLDYCLCSIRGMTVSLA